MSNPRQISDWGRTPIHTHHMGVHFSQQLQYSTPHGFPSPMGMGGGWTQKATLTVDFGENPWVGYQVSKHDKIISMGIKWFPLAFIWVGFWLVVRFVVVCVWKIIPLRTFLPWLSGRKETCTLLHCCGGWFTPATRLYLDFGVRISIDFWWFKL